MSDQQGPPESVVGRVLVFAKGFRVSNSTEEFQLVVPPTGGDLESTTEHKTLWLRGWQATIQQFYDLSERDAERQRCLLIIDGDCVLIAIRKSVDSHGRPSVVCVAVVCSPSGDHSDASTVNRSDALARRLAASYANVFADGAQEIESQLRAGSFLPNRYFDLAEEPPLEKDFDWSRALSALREWHGVTGFATQKMSALGANVLLGTKHEAERAVAAKAALDGFLAPGSSQIRQLGSGITTAIEEEASPPSDLTGPATSDLEPILDRLDRQNSLLSELLSLGGEILNALSGRKRRRR